MIVSWNWLKQYIALDMPLAELERRLMMAGLNHEGTEDVDGDLAIDLEVTSNRPDCLSHIGVAREVAVLWQRELQLPTADPTSDSMPVGNLVKVGIECPQLCHRYTARVIRGVKIGRSPKWMTVRLKTAGIASVNNVVDATNYVMMECGQPLHAFDLRLLAGPEIIVRAGRRGERFEAINHKTYELCGDDCIIADAAQAIGIGGVMGGAQSEVSDATVDVLIEAAHFDPPAIRNTARRLNLHSESSHRFERGIDPAGVDWASRRCCQLILELAGGELADGVVDVGRQPEPRAPVALRLAQLKRILGIDVAPEEVRRILTALGNREVSFDGARVQVVPPSWRGDLAREIDLVEEVARIHGYDEIPENVSVPMTSSSRRRTDRVLSRARHVLTALGYDEAMTLSALTEEQSGVFSPWTDLAPIIAQTPILRGARFLRRSLVTSLLEARRLNEASGNERIELFEIANVYLPGKAALPDEVRMLALTSGDDFYHVKGTIESLAEALNPQLALETRPAEIGRLSAVRAAEMWLAGERLGYLGELAPEGLEQFGLRGATSVAEIRADMLVELADLVRIYRRQPPFPAVERDVNLVVDESVRWAQIAEHARSQAGALLEDLTYRETYRSEQLGAGKKSLLFTLRFRDPNRTLTGPEIDEVFARIVNHCAGQLGAALRA